MGDPEHLRDYCFAAWLPADQMVGRGGGYGRILFVPDLVTIAPTDRVAIEYCAQTGSTNSDLMERLNRQDPVAEGQWLVADRQSGGRGRQGRKWSDGLGNFMGSTVVYPKPGDPAISSLSFLVALAVYETCLQYLPEQAPIMLKWPNDLLLNNGKLSGILLEGFSGAKKPSAQGDHGGQSAIIIGIGVNLCGAPDLSDRPSAALNQYGQTAQRNDFAERLAAQFALELRRWRDFGTEPIFRRWQAAAHPIGSTLKFHESANSLISGTYEGLDGDGALMLRLADGSRRVIHAGDVTLTEGAGPS